MENQKLSIPCEVWYAIFSNIPKHYNTKFIFKKRIALGVHINLDVHLCIWCTTKVNVKIELQSGLIQHKFLVFIKLFHWNILLHFKENVCQYHTDYKITFFHK